LNVAYERIKDEKYHRIYKLGVRGLKSSLETTRLELENQKRFNQDLQRRLKMPEPAKELEGR
jgi:hypothetical protein